MVIWCTLRGHEGLTLIHRVDVDEAVLPRMRLVDAIPKAGNCSLGREPGPEQRLV